MANPALDTALAGVDDAKKSMDDTYNSFRAQTSGQAAPAAMKKWTVKMTDGTIYRGVQANTPEEAQQKMLNGPQGPLTSSPAGSSQSPLAPPPFSPAPGKEMPTPAPRTPTGGANFTGLPEAATAVGALAGGPALGAAGLASDMLSDKPAPSTTGREVAGDLVPLGVGALIRPARTIGSALKTVGANVLGRGALEGGVAAAQGEESPLSAGVVGAAKGILPGLAQAGAGAVLGPTGDTRQVQKAAKAFKGELSPNLAKLIDPNKPASLLSGKSVKSLQSAAGANLDKMEAEVDKLLGPTMRFTSAGQTQGPLSPDVAKLQQMLGSRPGDRPINFQGATGMVPSQQMGQTFAEMRAQIKELRSFGDKQFGPDAARTAAAAKQDAMELERAMVKQMTPNAAAAYEKGIAQHAKDSGAIRWLKDVQKNNAVSGGANPIDRPGLGAADEAISQRGGPLKPILHGALGAAEVAMGKGVGGAYHLSRAADTARAAAGPLKPQKTARDIVPRISGALAGVGTAKGQSYGLKNLKAAEE